MRRVAIVTSLVVVTSSLAWPLKNVRSLVDSGSREPRRRQPAASSVWRRRVLSHSAITSAGALGSSWRLRTYLASGPTTQAWTMSSG